MLSTYYVPSARDTAVTKMNKIPPGGFGGTRLMDICKSQVMTVARWLE